MDAHTIALNHAALVHRLGGAACVLPVPTAVEGLHEVGELADLCCWSGVATHGETRQLARNLTKRGMLGLLITEHPDGTSRHLVPTIDSTRITILPAVDPDALALRRLARFTATRSAGPPLAAALGMVEALDVDASGRKTFATLRKLLDDGVQLLPARMPAHARHAWLLLQLTRLLFLRFVESEGWLNGETRFLGDRFDECLAARRNPHQHLLAPLFFGTLNRPPRKRSRLARSFGQVPFLNGGLFEPHDLERRQKLHLPLSYWRHVVDRLVVRTEVTLDHDDLTGSVTPEMLGRVFEGVMEIEERKQSGAFFTPPDLVAAVVRETLVCHLAPRLARDEASVAQSLADPDPELHQAMLNTTVLDPAVGSGAFLVGALQLLHGPGPQDSRRVRHLVTRRLYGVDRNPTAVRLTELRLWLEVLRAARGSPIARVRPLPNLDTTVRAGDALLDPVLGTLGVPMVRRLQRAQVAIAGTHGTEKRERLRRWRRSEVTALQEALSARATTIEAEIRELVTSARTPTLFGDPSPLRASDRRALHDLHELRQTIRSELRRSRIGTSTVPFAMSAAFAPILQGRGGFDVIVGNPPWVRAERLPQATRAGLALRYRWWRSLGQRGFRHLPDLSVAFLERCVELLMPGGTLGLLVPTKITTAGYAATARAELARQTTLHLVADLASDPRAVFDATTYPLALIASRTPPLATHRTRIAMGPDAPSHQQIEWATTGPWLLTSPDAHAITRRLGRDHERLASVFTPQLGVKTGANAAFLDPPPELTPWCRMAIRGRDLRAFRVDPRHLMLWPADERGAPWQQLPPKVETHLRPYERLLRARADYVQGPWWQLFRVQAATAPHRVVWGDLARRLEVAVVPRADWVPVNSCYVIATPSELVARALTAWLNSTWIRALARLSAEPAAGDAARFGARAVGSVPWVEAALTDSRLLQLPHPTAATADDAVADHLALSSRDRAALAPLASRRR